MQFMLMLKADTGKNVRPTPELMDAMGKLVEEATKAGILVETGGMQGAPAATSLRLAGGKVSVTDGPYAESKELVGGYAIIDVKSREEAVAMGKRFLEIHARILGPSCELESEVRQMFPVGASDGNGRSR